MKSLVAILDAYGHTEIYSGVVRYLKSFYKFLYVTKCLELYLITSYIGKCVVYCQPKLKSNRFSLVRILTH